jgi:hypothetical protein
VRDEFADALLLAQFANLDNGKPSEVENFRKSIAPGFIPEPWWDFEGRKWEGWKLWEEMQDLLRSTWDAGFPLDHTFSFITSAHSQRTNPEISGEAVDIIKALPYQRGAMFLFNESWRARRCERKECQKRFVAEKPNSSYCSHECYAEARRKYKADYINARRAKERDAKRKKKEARKSGGN